MTPFLRPAGRALVEGAFEALQNLINSPGKGVDDPLTEAIVSLENLDNEGLNIENRKKILEGTKGIEALSSLYEALNSPTFTLAPEIVKNALHLLREKQKKEEGVVAGYWKKATEQALLFARQAFDALAKQLITPVDKDS